jgi:uncharacterized SAM-dependent methyltransferase
MATPPKHNTANNNAVSNNRFLVDAINLFSKDRSGHMSRYAYTHGKGPNDPARGAEYWKEFIAQSSDYYMYNEERDLIQDNVQRIIAHLPDNISVIELGPGESRALREKSIPLLRAFNNASGNYQSSKKLHEYIALDISKGFAEGAESRVAKQLRIPTSSIVSDFTSDTLIINTEETPVLTVYGGTLLNASIVKGFSSEYAFKSYLDNVRDIIGEDGYLIMTQDTNFNHHDLLKAYKHERAEKAALSIMHRIERDLDTRNFSGHDFDHVIRWNPYMSLLTLNAVSKVDKVIKIGGVSFTLNKGDEFPLVNAFKYSNNRFNQIVKDAGFEILDSITNGKEDRIALHVMRVSPPKF